MPARKDARVKSPPQGKETSGTDKARKATVAAAQKVKCTALVTWHDLEAWQQDNHYIQTGYRPASDSYTTSAASIAYLHNESVNIWSHLLGAAFFALAAYPVATALAARYAAAADAADALALACFFAGAIGCLGMSATYHAISNHSHAVATFGNKLDYLGIVLLIWGSFVPSIFYGFACDPPLRNAYWAMISTIGLGCAVTSSADRFRTPRWRPFRAAMFVAMGLSAVVPVLHGLRLYGVRRLSLQIGLPWLVAQGVLYIAGAALYAARVPERYSPGTFDVWGSSHQIFHFLVVLAALAHLYGLLMAFDYRHSNSAAARCAVLRRGPGLN